MRIRTTCLWAVSVAVAVIAGYVCGAAHGAATAAPVAPAIPPALAAVPPAAPARPLRLGVIGDSLTLPDQGAQADSWLRVLVDSKRVTCGAERPAPQAFAGRTWEHAWVASGATTQTAFDRGWVAAAARALRAGELDAVVVMIGIDDLALFQGEYLRNAAVSDAQWDAACTRIEGNWLRMAHELQVGSGLVVFSEVPDPTGIPMISALLRHDDAARTRLQAVAQRLNGYLADLALRRNLPLFDLLRRQRELALDPAAQRLPGVTLLPLASGQQADRGFAIDGIHLGPVPTALLAAGLVEVFNCYHAGIAPLEPAEVSGSAQAFAAALKLATTIHPAPAAN